MPLCTICSHPWRWRHTPTNEAPSCEDPCIRFTVTLLVKVDDSWTGLDMVCVCVRVCVCVCVCMCAPVCFRDRDMAKERFSNKLHAVGHKWSCWGNILKTRRHILVQCVALFCSALPNSEATGRVDKFFCSVLQCGTVCYSVVQCGAVWCSVL